MSRKKEWLLLASGIVVGMMMGPTLASAAENWLKATPSTQIFIVDGQNVELEAYAIGGYNYVKLRDVGKAVGFDVSYDAQCNAAVIDSTRPYYDDEAAKQTATQAETQASATDQQTVTDYAKDANQDVFTGGLTASTYNTIRQTVLSGESTAFEPSAQKYTGDELQQIREVLAKLGRYPNYRLTVTDGYLCQVQYPESYDPAAEHTKSFIAGLNGMTEEEKVERIAWQVADRLTYDGSCYAWPNQVLTQDGVVRGACMSYAYSFQFLCQQAEIPCILIANELHEWNMVYVNGTWWDVDVTANDTGDNMSREYWHILTSPSERYGEVYQDSLPEVTEFAKEVLVPGSTK